MSSFQVGFGSIYLYPRGVCSCGHPEVIDGVKVHMILFFKDKNCLVLNLSLTLLAILLIFSIIFIIGFKY